MPGRFLVPPMMRAGYKAPAKTSMSEIGQKAGGFFKENYDPRDSFFKKDTVEGRNINNLYTGYKLGGKGNLLVTGSILGGGTLVATNARGVSDNYAIKNAVSSESENGDIESLQSTRADGQGYQASIGANALANLSTSGDLVFAMHKTRHSGQF